MVFSNISILLAIDFFEKFFGHFRVNWSSRANEYFSGLADIILDQLVLIIGLFKGKTFCYSFKIFKSFSNEYIFVCLVHLVSQFFEMILFVFWLELFNWSAGQLEYVWVFHSTLWIVFQDLSCYVFFYFVVMIFVTTIWRRSHFLFSRSCNFNWIACVTSFFALSGEFFCSCAWLNFWSHLTYLTLKNDFLTLKLTFTLIQRDKVKWVCVTLNEGYLRSANRGSNNLYRFLIKI